MSALPSLRETLNAWNQLYRSGLFICLFFFFLGGGGGRGGEGRGGGGAYKDSMTQRCMGKCSDRIQGIISKKSQNVLAKVGFARPALAEATISSSVTSSG